jgi:hypothetical protein
LPTVNATPDLKGIFMIHPSGDFQSCFSWKYEQTNDPNHKFSDTWIKPVIAPCVQNAGSNFGAAWSTQVVIEDIATGQPWDGNSNAKVTIQNRLQQGYYTNPDEDINGTRLVYGKEVHLEAPGHPYEGRGESQRQVWEITFDPYKVFVSIKTDIGSILQGATPECLQNYANQKPVRTPCTGEFFWMIQPVLHD